MPVIAASVAVKLYLNINCQNQGTPLFLRQPQAKPGNLRT